MQKNQSGATTTNQPNSRRSTAQSFLKSMHLGKASVVAALALGLAMPLVSTSAEAADAFKIVDGKLVRPTGYREWVFLGVPLTPNDMNNGKATFPEFHHVYIDPESWKVWKATGKFREGTIIIKELISVGSKSAVSGAGYFEGDYVGLEATIKSKKHFPNEPGNWAYYSFSSEDHKTLSKTTAAFPAAACNSCHAAAAADDFVFTQYYPVLRATKGRGEMGTGGKHDDLSKEK